MMMTVVGQFMVWSAACGIDVEIIILIFRKINVFYIRNNQTLKNKNEFSEIKVLLNQLTFGAVLFDSGIFFSWVPLQFQNCRGSLQIMLWALLMESSVHWLSVYIVVCAFVDRRQNLKPAKATSEARTHVQRFTNTAKHPASKRAMSS